MVPPGHSDDSHPQVVRAAQHFQRSEHEGGDVFAVAAVVFLKFAIGFPVVMVWRFRLVFCDRQARRRDIVDQRRAPSLLPGSPLPLFDVPSVLRIGIPGLEIDR
jgi:hypothetical protein